MAQESPNGHHTGVSKAFAFSLLVIGLAIGGVLGYLTPRPAPTTPLVVSPPLSTETPSPTSTPAPLRIHVSGAVAQPAVYRLPPGSIVQDALEAAGGPTAKANLDAVNLAVELQDQQKVHIPAQGEENAPPAVSGGEPADGDSGQAAGLVNINTASQAELETLPRVGPATAQRIIDHRQANGLFDAVEDIQNVAGIGPATFEGLQDLITVGD